MALRVGDVGCRYCGDEETYMAVTEEPSVYKIGARCFGCNEDYGVLRGVSWSEVGHIDELYEEAENAVREFFGEGG